MPSKWLATSTSSCIWRSQKTLDKNNISQAWQADERKARQEKLEANWPNCRSPLLILNSNNCNRLDFSPLRVHGQPWKKTRLMHLKLRFYSKTRTLFICVCATLVLEKRDIVWNWGNNQIKWESYFQKHSIPFHSLVVSNQSLDFWNFLNRLKKHFVLQFKQHYL